LLDLINKKRGVPTIFCGVIPYKISLPRSVKSNVKTG